MITVPLLEPIRDTLGKTWSSRYFSNRDSHGVQCVVPERDFDLLCTPLEIAIMCIYLNILIPPPPPSPGNSNPFYGRSMDILILELHKCWYTP